MSRSIGATFNLCPAENRAHFLEFLKRAADACTHRR